MEIGKSFSVGKCRSQNALNMKCHFTSYNIIYKQEVIKHQAVAFLPNSSNRKNPFLLITYISDSTKTGLRHPRSINKNLIFSKNMQ